jgi:hypothetical protein
MSPEKQQEQIKAYNSEIGKIAETRFDAKRENADASRKVAGIDVGEAAYQGFKEAFVKMTTANDKGEIEMNKMLSDDNELFEFLKYRHFKPQIDAAIVKATSAGKWNALSLMSDTHTRVAGGDPHAAQERSQTEIDDRLKAPEGTYK